MDPVTGLREARFIPKLGGKGKGWGFGPAAWKGKTTQKIEMHSSLCRDCAQVLRTVWFRRDFGSALGWVPVGRLRLDADQYQLKTLTQASSELPGAVPTPAHLTVPRELKHISSSMQV